MCRPQSVFTAWVASALFATVAIPASAQGPGGVPGAPMAPMGRSSGQNPGLGAPGAPMARMGGSRSGGLPQAAPSRRSYGAFGVQGRMTSENYRGRNLASQASGMGVQRSSAGIIQGTTRGIVTLPSAGR